MTEYISKEDAIKAIDKAISKAIALSTQEVKELFELKEDICSQKGIPVPEDVRINTDMVCYMANVETLLSRSQSENRELKRLLKLAAEETDFMATFQYAEDVEKLIGGTDNE